MIAVGSCSHLTLRVKVSVTVSSAKFHSVSPLNQPLLRNPSLVTSGAVNLSPYLTVWFSLVASANTPPSALNVTSTSFFSNLAVNVVSSVIVKSLSTVTFVSTSLTILNQPLKS